MDEKDKKRFVLERLDKNIRLKAQIEKLYCKMLGQGQGLKYLLFSKWKALPDVKTSMVDKAANKMEEKLAGFLSKSMLNGLTPLKEELKDGQNRQAAAARALIASSTGDLRKMYNRWR